MRKLQAIRDEMKGSREHIEELIAKYNTAVFLAQKEKDPNAIQKIKEE